MADAESADFYFQDLAQHNEAAHSQLDAVEPLAPAEMPGVPAGVYTSVAAGQQAVSKGQQGQQALNKVQVLLCCVRLPQHQVRAPRAAWVVRFSRRLAGLRPCHAKAIRGGGRGLCEGLQPPASWANARCAPWTPYASWGLQLHA